MKKWFTLCMAVLLLLGVFAGCTKGGSGGETTTAETTTSPLETKSAAITGDCLDYMEWKTGTRLTGMGSAIQSFVTKLGAALSTSFIILMYIIVDLDVGSINASVTANPLLMSHGVRNGIFSVVSLIPAISLLVCTIPMFFYNLTGDFREKMETELAAQREKKGITITD